MQGLFFEPPLEANAWGHIFEEIYKSGLFERVLPNKKEGSVVIDCGANVGIASYYFSSRFETVYAIEPSDEHFKVLNYMLEYNKITNVKPFQFAVSSKDGESEFYHYTNKTMYSLYGNLAAPEIAAGGLAMTGHETVPLKRLDTFVREQNIKHIDLLKLDVEGVEFEVVGSDSFSNIAPIVDMITCEVHPYGQRNPHQILDALKLRGFKVEIVPNDANLLIGRK